MKPVTRRFLIGFLAILSFACTGGGGSGGGGGGGGGGGTGTDGEGVPGEGTGQLYVVNSDPTDGNSILRFPHATTTRGNVTPEAVIQGTNTTLDQPQMVFFDLANDRLYVANKGANTILVFDGLSSLEGDVAPARTIGSTSLNGPADVVVDVITNRMYVSNSGAGNILVFSGATTLDGPDLVPIATVTTSPVLKQNQGMFLDLTNDLLYLADTNSDAVKVLSSPSTWSGTMSATVTRTISGSLSQVQKPVSVLVDSKGKLTVLNRQSGVFLVFNSALTVNGNLAPNKTLGGSNTGLDQPAQFLFDETNDEMYVANSKGHGVFTVAKFSTVSGNVDASRKIRGDKTGLFSSSSAAITATGVAVDLTR